MTRRFLFVQLPYFPTKRFIKINQENTHHTKPWWDAQADRQAKCEAIKKGPLVLVQNGVKGTRISAVSVEAEREGLWPDMKLADARTMMPNLRVEQHDVSADQILFNKLAHWMLRYSPAVAIHENHGFVLDITGCDHLFGGEIAMARDIEQRFARNGFRTRIAIGNTVAACFALVHYSVQTIHISPVDHAKNELDGLPVDALRLNDETIILLKRLGLKRIGDVRILPRAALERRFRDSKKSPSKKQVSGLARAVQWRLDQLSGAIAEPLDYIVEPQGFRVSKQCPALALEQGAVAIALDELLPQLCTSLKSEGKGARQFCLTGYRADGGASYVSVSLSQPVNTAHTIKRLFKDRLDQIDCGFGIDLFTLEASAVSSMGVAQYDMMDTHNAALTSASLAGFADTVINRVGQKAVSRLAPSASHVPERAQRFVPVSKPANWQQWKIIEPVWSPRPTRLLTRPEPAQVTAELPDSPPLQFVWRKVLRKVVRSRGPERILPEWWHDSLKSKSSAAYRDYYDVEDERGLRYWLFRATKLEPRVTHDNDNADGETQTVLTSSWFVHGLF